MNIEGKIIWIKGSAKGFQDGTIDHPFDRWDQRVDAIWPPGKPRTIAFLLHHE